MPCETPITQALRSQETAFGFWLTLPSAAVAKTVLRAQARSSQTPRFSWVLIDAEHGLISDANYYELTTAIGSEGTSPLIRVPQADEHLIKRALDSSAHGVVVPMCHTADQACSIVRSCKYPPVGTRGYGPTFADHSMPQQPTGGNQDYESIAGGLQVIVQIESRSGVDEVESIAAVEGVDVLFVGPFDLARQLGVERGGAEHERVVRRILHAAHAAGKKAAIFCTDGADARVRVGQGFDMVSVATDVGVLADGMVREVDLAAASGLKLVDGGVRDKSESNGYS